MAGSPQRARIPSNNTPQHAELRRIETLCNTLYNGSNHQAQHAAQTQLNLLATSVSYIPQCQFVLDHSQNPYAILIASEALTTLITSHWNHFTTRQRVQIRDYLVAFLGNKGPPLAKTANFVVTSVVKLLSRITRLGWFDDPKHQALVEEVKKFLQATVPHCIIGLQILEELTVQMNERQATETVSQLRKHAVSYRDASLKSTFQIALTMLQQLHAGQVTNADPAQLSQMKKRALGLGIRCLNFDFIGMQPDPSLEDNETIQIPSTWRPLVTNAQTMQLMTKLYLESEPAEACLAMELLMLWSSCRRSLFVREEDRKAFLSELLDAILMVLKTQKGLNHEENYHAFCRLLGRVKNNFQLTELLQARQWAEFALQVTNFTVQSFSQWKWSKNSTHYLLHLWNRLVSVSPFVRDPENKIQPLIKTYVPRVFSTYVQGRLQSVEDCVRDEGLENPLDDESQLQQQLQQVPNLTRYQYEGSGAILVSLFEPLAQQYSQLTGQVAQALASMPAGAELPPQLRLPLRVVEGKLTWLVYLIGAQIGGHMTMASAGREGHELTDASMARGCFQLMGMVDSVLTGSQGRVKCDRRLEIAMLFFFTEFRRCYVGEHHGMPSAKETAKQKKMAAKARAASQGGPGAAAPTGGPFASSGAYAVAGRRLMLANGGGSGAAGAAGAGGKTSGGVLSSASSRVNKIPGKTKSSSERKREMYQRMFVTMGIGDHVAVINTLVHKVRNNLTYWAQDLEVVKSTLSVFYWLSAGYGSGKFMLSLEATKLLLANHGPRTLAFLNFSGNTRQRTSFYKTLARLVFIGDYENMLRPFLRDILLTMKQLGDSLNAGGTPGDQAKFAMIGVCRDLRGIFSAALGSHSYGLLFDAIYPVYLKPLGKAAAIWAGAPEVMNPLLKFYAELVNAKGQRIKFAPSSPNGILLFREISGVVVTYGRALLSGAKPGDSTREYSHWYKGMSLLLMVMSQALQGNYVNFGVFELYKDPALSSSLQVSLQVFLTMQLAEIMSYPKVSCALLLAYRLTFNVVVGRLVIMVLLLTRTPVHNTHAHAHALTRPYLVLSFLFVSPYPLFRVFSQVVKSYFTYLNVIFRYHMGTIVKVDSNTFLKLIEAFREGLAVATDPSIINLCAQSIDHFATFHFNYSDRPNKPNGAALRSHLQHAPTAFTTFFVMLLNNVMYRNLNTCWSISRPLLSIILANERTLEEAKQQVLATQPPQNHARFTEAFSKMMLDIGRNLETSNRDRFSQRVNQFRAEVKTFMVRPVEFDAL